MNKIVNGVEVNMTAQEEAEVRADWDRVKKPKPDASDTTNLQKELKAVVLAAALLAGKTPAQAKAAYKAAFDSL
jgi:uncharacterized protein YabN with tetrapyrrole methylase and pyrophosphatase domain